MYDEAFLGGTFKLRSAHRGTYRKNVMDTRSRLESQTDLNPISVIWVTNMAAPYRIPVWQSLQKRVLIKIALLESRTSLASDVEANRGPDWIPARTDEINFMEIPTRKVKRGEARYYFPTQFRSALLPREHDVLIFGGWESPVYWVLLIGAKIFNTGCVAFYESTLTTMRHRRGLISWIRRGFFHAMDSIVVPGPAARDALLSIGVPADKILQGFNAVDVSAFEATTRLNAPEESHGHAFLYVGQLIPRKRVAEIVEAFSAIAAPNDTFTIVGSGEQAGELRNKTEANANICLLPYVDYESMPEVMAGHNTLVLASSEEVWGLVVNEALASGLHTVVSQNCGVVPSIEDMAGVFVAEPGLTDLAAKMAASRSSWAGPVINPEILRHTPEEFASVFFTAIGRSV